MRQNAQKTKKLAAKVTGLIFGVLFAVFTALILFSLVYTKGAVLNATYNDLTSNSKANGCQIQSFMDDCQSTALSLGDKIVESMEAAAYSQGSKMERSVVYTDLSLNQDRKDLESYLIATAKNAVKHNSAIAGIGIMFEPYQFSPDRESYALYFKEENGEIGVSDVGAYAEFSANEYYQIAVGKTGTVFVKPYVYRDIWMITGATPILVDGKMIGVINVDVSMDEFNKLSLTNENYPSMNIVLSSGDGTISYDSSNKDNIGKNMKEVLFADQTEATQTLSKLSSTEQFQETYRSLSGVKTCGFYYPLKAGTETWQTITNVSVSDIERASTRTIFYLSLFCVLSLAVILFVVAATLHKSLKPIQIIVDAADEIAKGRLDIQIPAKSNDEIGLLANAFNTIAEGLKGIIDDENDLLGEMAKGNFDVHTRAEKYYVGDFAPLLQSIRNIKNSLSGTLSQINRTSNEVATGSGQVSSGAQALSQGATEQAGAVEQLAATIGEISTKIESTAESATSASRKAKAVEGEAAESNRRMQEMLSAMSDISTSSNEIGKIIKTIEDIAFQTNILALNAAVEAARAGAAGKGFAVVADEVRNLASKSAQASKNTSTLIENSLRSVEHGRLIADETANSLSSVVSGIQEVASTIDEISEASSAEAGSVSQIQQGVEQISNVVQQNSATAQESAATSEELSAQAQALKALVSRFRLGEGLSSERLESPVPQSGRRALPVHAPGSGQDLALY